MKKRIKRHKRKAEDIVEQEDNGARRVHHRNVVGRLINFRGLVYAPVNENGVIFLFGKMAFKKQKY